MRSSLTLSAVPLAAMCLWNGCASGPTAPEKGTPPFYWQAARETFTAGDYLKANDHLEQLTKSQNEFTARAAPWQLILIAGLAGGYMELADSFENGARANKANPTPFRKQVNDYRTMANRLVLAFAERFEKFEADSKDPKIGLEFPVPAGSVAPIPALGKVATGILPAAGEVDDMQKRALERGVLHVLSRAAGAAGDIAKLREIFKTQPVAVPRETFFLAMAQSLYEQSQLFNDFKLAQPDKVKYFCTHAAEALKGVPDSKESKELKDRIQAAMKKVKS